MKTMKYTLKQTPFKTEQIEICRNCQGVGFVPNGYNGQAQPVCPVCDGSGRIKKVTEGTVLIMPYNNDNSN